MSRSVLFVCVRNGGKSQMAAGLMRRAAPDVDVHSAGTQPGTSLNALSVQSLSEVGIDIAHESPKAVDPHLIASVDLVVTLGRDATLEPPPGVEVRNWDTDEPSERGIDGLERMRLVRDDIGARIHALAEEFDAQVSTT